VIHLSHSVTGSLVGHQLAQDEEELAEALVSIAEVGPDETAISDFLVGDERERVRAFCQSLAEALST
jgi:hypothetical protein